MRDMGCGIQAAEFGMLAEGHPATCILHQLFSSCILYPFSSWILFHHHDKMFPLLSSSLRIIPHSAGDINRRYAHPPAFSLDHSEEVPGLEAGGEETPDQD